MSSIDTTFLGAVPILFVRDVTKAAAFYAESLGFQVDFLHGNPPFYGSVSRDHACLHLRFVHEPNFAALAARETSLILATIEVRNVTELFEQYERRGVEFAQPLVRQAWGGVDFHVRDIDGNVISVRSVSSRQYMSDGVLTANDGASESRLHGAAWAVILKR